MSSTYTCLSCEEKGTANYIQLPCHQHSYCNDCFKVPIQMAIDEEQYYPLRCGGSDGTAISDDFIHDCLVEGDSESLALLDCFEAKAEEYQVPAKDRAYCANDDCITAQGHSRFIHHQISGSYNRVMCPDCNGITCRHCKVLVADESEHTCEDPKYDKMMKEYLDSLPEEERWLSRKCPSCGIWTNKTDCCNHMTCRCGGQFCLVCGRVWGLVSCPWGCPKYEPPVYDEEGYNQNGFHPDTGLDRQGHPWDPNHEHDTAEDQNVWIPGNPDVDDAWNEVLRFDEEGFDQHGRDVDGYDRDGYNADGFNRAGLDREGYDWAGFNANGVDREGYDWNGRDADGYDRQGLDYEGYDKDGWDINGFNRSGFNANGISLRNLHRDYYDEEGYDPFGFNVFGYSRAGLDVDGWDEDGYDADGYNRDGYDRNGYDVFGYDFDGYDEHGRDRLGITRDGFNRHHRNPAGDIEPGYYVDINGDCRKIVPEGPHASVMDCDHDLRFTRQSGTCPHCEWYCDVFCHQCTQCGTKFCRRCTYLGAEVRNQTFRERFLWPPPGSDSYGIKEMVGPLERFVEFEKLIAYLKEWPPIRRHSVSKI